MSVSSVPFGNITARSKEGSNEDGKEAQQECRRLKKRWMRDRTEKAWEEFKLVRNFKNYMIVKATRKSFQTFIGQAYESLECMWKETKWSRDDTQKQANIRCMEQRIDRHTAAPLCSRCIR